MVNNIIKNIPKEYYDNLYVLPHPLILDKLKNTDLNKWIPDIISYDKILEDTALLITDYSSISYSAFYRGANVIFCWEELDECMNNYNSHLMLNKKNAFGDISYKYEDIYELVKKNYLKPQRENYKKNYKKIVEFNDNKNTDRLIEYLKKDNII
jgi:CDP-glycerol glycerophosphotransferase (TagB/SpsB family)